MAKVAAVLLVLAGLLLGAAGAAGPPTLQKPLIQTGPGSDGTLPGWAQQVGRMLPLTHGIAAAREVVAGSTLADVAGLVVTEAVIGIAYATLAYGLFRWFEVQGRRNAALDAF